ncbi:helix-turn-helix domain-containing protein [Mycolicibacterium fortuitum]|nr:helix-turn-helix domain-containing protein [Mycolicibacterium fortuitum]
MIQSVVEDGYQNTTVADIVRRAKTSRRTFYEHFASREECFVALLTSVNTKHVRKWLAGSTRVRPGRPRSARRSRRGSARMRPIPS